MSLALGGLFTTEPPGKPLNAFTPGQPQVIFSFRTLQGSTEEPPLILRWWLRPIHDTYSLPNHGGIRFPLGNHYTCEGLKWFYVTTSLGLPWWLSGVKSASDAEDAGSISGSERSPGGRARQALQYSCLGNPLDREDMAGYNPRELRSSWMGLGKTMPQKGTD